jgi:hypothetical protein
LRDRMCQAGRPLNERAIRKWLRALRADGLVEWGFGRGGVRLTPKGKNARRHARGPW